MSTAQWLLNFALLAFVLGRNLGVRPVTAGTFLVPAVVVLAAAAGFLRDVPTAGNDVALEAGGTVVGLALGLGSALLTRVHAREGRLVVSAGAGFAALWIVVVGGRVTFAEWATHGGSRAVAEFSVRHQITGAEAWTAAFVLMALAMVVARYAVTAAVVERHLGPRAGRLRHVAEARSAVAHAGQRSLRRCGGPAGEARLPLRRQP